MIISDNKEEETFMVNGIGLNGRRIVVKRSSLAFLAIGVLALLLLPALCFCGRSAGYLGGQENRA